MSPALSAKIVRLKKTMNMIYDKEKKMRKAIEIFIKRVDAEKIDETKVIAHNYVTTEGTVEELALLMSKRIIGRQMPMSALEFATAKFSTVFRYVHHMLG